MSPVRNLCNVYVLESAKDKRWYTGCMNNLNSRIREHNSGKVYAAKPRQPLNFIYCEISLNKYDTFQREKYLKSGMGRRYIKNRLKNYFNKK